MRIDKMRKKNEENIGGKKSHFYWPIATEMI